MNKMIWKIFKLLFPQWSKDVFEKRWDKSHAVTGVVINIPEEYEKMEIYVDKIKIAFSYKLIIKRGI